MCTSVTHGAGVWLGADVAPHWPELRQSVWRDSVAPAGVAQLTDLFHRTLIESHHVRWRESRRSHANHHGTTHRQNMAPLLLSFFLPSFSSTHLAAAPLAILSSLAKSEPLVREINSMSWYRNCIEYVCRLYRLILLYFEMFVWMNSCGRD
jgi:hypothetical protein